MGMVDFEKENPLAKEVVECVFKVHKALGAGLLESAYEECLEKEFVRRNILFKRQAVFPIYYEGELLETIFRADFIIDGCIILELKSTEKIIPAHEAQILTYLKLSGVRMGLLINFGSPLIKDGIRRFVI